VELKFVVIVLIILYYNGKNIKPTFSETYIHFQIIQKYILRKVHMLWLFSVDKSRYGVLVMFNNNVS
jgi:hypothetical protein